jgi:L-ascorbate metabolism protein UlaG (beta-lactamase superfamily)
MIKPILQDEAFLADIESARRMPKQLHIWWLGQSGFFVLWKGSHLLLDPYLSDSLTRKYEHTDKPHVRMTERVVAPERLNFVQVITSSHNHTDHLDSETILPMLRSNPGIAVIVSEANRGFAAERLGVEPEQLIGLAPGREFTIGPYSFHVVPSAHENLDFDNNGNPKYMGLIVQAGRWTIYHSGDTIRYPGMAERLQPWEINVAMLPINGSDPRRQVAGNLTAQEAAELGRDVGAGLVIPCHYEMFEFNTASPEDFIRAAQAVGQGYRVLKCGDRLDLGG